MKIIQEKAIDIIYLTELEELAKWYEEDLDFALKQCISIHHQEIFRKETNNENNQH